MGNLSRRQFGVGSIAAAAALHLPVSFNPRPMFSIESLPADLKEVVGFLIADNRTFLLADRNYDNDDHELCGPYAWRESYAAMFDAHEHLRETIKEDTPLTRAVLAWANRLVPCPGRLAIQFWKPVRGLSEAYEPLQQQIWEARKCNALTTWTFWTRFPDSHIGEEETLENFQACLSTMNEAGHAWHKLWREVTEKWAQTCGDRELARRVTRSHDIACTLDVPYLRDTVVNWRPYGGWPQQPRCPLPCHACDQLGLPVLRDV